MQAPKLSPWSTVPKKLTVEQMMTKRNDFLPIGSSGRGTRNSPMRMRENVYNLGGGVNKTGGFSNFPQGYIGQPFWFSNIGGNHFPREGFTYTPFDLPVIPFDQQMQSYLDDEDATMAINFLAAKTTGASYFWKAKSDTLMRYVDDFCHKINLDLMAWQIAKELLAFGNSFWKLRVPIMQVRSFDDFLQIPIDSAARIWWTPDRIPQWYEFRGAHYNGYFMPEEILHFTWNRTNGQVFGFGAMAQLTNRVTYFEDTVNGPVMKVRESYMDIKHGLQNVIYKTSKRYLPRNVWGAAQATNSERDNMRSALTTLQDSEDIIHGIKGMTVQELGNQTRAFDPAAYMDMYQSGIFKAVGTSKGRIDGQSSGPTYANGEQSAILDDIGLSHFPIQLKQQLIDLIIRPWYETQPIGDPSLDGGLGLFIPWSKGQFELSFGKATKNDLKPAEIKLWADSLLAAGSITPDGYRKMAEAAGVTVPEESIEALQQERQKKMIQNQQRPLTNEIPNSRR